jgi:hypothetical protein
MHVDDWAWVCSNSSGQCLVHAFFLIGAFEAIALVINPSDVAHFDDRFDRKMGYYLYLAGSG